ncbi:MAG TPA: hypothetical protein VM680_10680 [Verrucomicrobiae bacterium]|nr:hypothetical protein [Verrucomicrobiae bacterium]
MKMRSDCILQELTPTQLDLIFELLSAGYSFRQVRLHCAKPPPEGLGLEIHHTTLCRFFKAERRRRHAEDLVQSKFDDLASNNPDELLQNVRVELAHACYDLASEPQPTAINALSRVTHRIDRLKLDQQRIAIEQERLTLERDSLAEKVRQFNFNAAREAAKHAAEIHKVIEAKGPDAEDKTWMVSHIVFGPSPNLPASGQQSS